ncbi:MAG: CAP domain-containing protein [Butyrivibrio sp.]|nr:CAP domain-containing protein [Butyrivibrio sp.]
MKRFIVIFVLSVIFGMIFNPVYAHAAMEDEIVKQLNIARVQAGLPEYTYCKVLSDAAKIRAKECSERFSHTRPDGKAWYTVSDYTNAENLAYARNDVQGHATNVVKAWLLSPSHKENVMSTASEKVGVAYYYDTDGDIYIVCEFD